MSSLRILFAFLQIVMRRAESLALYTLDISNNLLISWEEVAEIIACIPSLNKIIIKYVHSCLTMRYKIIDRTCSNCRIERLTRALHIKPPTTEFIRQSFKNIQELEFCNSYASWDDVSTSMEINLVVDDELTLLGHAHRSLPSSSGTTRFG